MVRIEILSGPEEGRIVELAPGKHSLGRAASCDLPIQADAVSGKHLELDVAADGVVRFRDLGSTNGTWSGSDKVTEGEWFPGTELRLGNCPLRLLDESGPVGSPADPAGSGADAEDAAVHRRALEQALSGKRRGGPGLLLLLLLLVAGAGGGYWWFVLRDDGAGGGATASGGGPASVGGTTTAIEHDLLAGLGSFDAEAASSWILPNGVSAAGGSLTSTVERARATCGQDLPLDDCTLRIAAQLSSGLSAWPEIEFGSDSDGGERVRLGRWSGAALGSGPVAVALPCERADWFRLSLRLEGKGSVRGLTVLGADGQATLANPENRPVLQDGANLLLLHHDGTALLEVAGSGGAWVAEAGGMRFTPSGEARLRFLPGAATEASGPSLVLAEGGPAEFGSGVQVSAAPGLLVGGEARRLWIDFETPANVIVGGDGARLTTSSPVRLRWDLSEALGESARLAREVDRANREGDTRRLLEVSAELLRDWPLDDAQVRNAHLLRRNALVDGRRDLGQLQTAVAEALFLSAADDLRRVEERARALAARLPGTDVARDAEAMAAVLEASAVQALAEDAVVHDEYRTRLLGALSRNFPVLAAWVEEQS